MVDPNQEFQVTDVVVGKVQPFRRLIVAGVSEPYCLVHYERGGRAHSWLIALFKLSNDQAKLVWVSILRPGRNLDFGELMNTVESGGLPDDTGHLYW